MVRKKSNTVLVREYIRKMIVNRGLKPGDMLPCEGDIAADLDVSKSCVREATHALESIGLIEIRHGVGLVLRDFNMDAVGDIFDYSFALDPTIVLDLYDLRRMMESALMPLVVERISKEELMQCEAILAEWNRLAVEGKPSYEIDGRFHETLYSVIGNRMVTALCHIFWTSYCELETNRILGNADSKNRESTEKTIEAHRRILKAVQQGDGSMASKLMYDHFVVINKAADLIGEPHRT